MGSQKYRRATAEIHRAAMAYDRARDAEMRAAMRHARENRTPKTAPVMPEVHVGDRIRPTIGSNLLVVVKVNRKSVVTAGGVKWAAGEFEVIR